MTTDDVLSQVRERQSREDSIDVQREMARQLPAEHLRLADADPEMFVRFYDAMEADLKRQRVEAGAKELSSGDGRALRSKLKLKEKIIPPKQKQEPSSEAGREGKLMEDVRRSGGSPDAVARYLQHQERKGGRK